MRRTDRRTALFGLALFVGAALFSCTERSGLPISPRGAGGPGERGGAAGPGSSGQAARAADQDAAPTHADLLLPGPAPRPALAPLEGMGLPTEEGCARCHQEIAAEWEGSLHHQAWQNTYFARAYRVERTPFCRKCHAPSADPSNEPSLEAQQIGVGCTTCHVVPEGIVGARSLPLPGHGHLPATDGHAVLGDARLATPAACGNCHDFAFPGPPGRKMGPMQDTLGEHARSAAAKTPCQGCHMREVPNRAGGRHKSHAFRVQGDKAMLAQAVEVASASLVQGEVRISLSPGRIGHAFPTGDLFRQAELRAVPVDASGRDLPGGSTEILGRTFTAAPVGGGALVGAERSDSRLGVPRSFALKVPAAARRVKWQIVWQRLPPWLAKSFHMEMTEHEMVVLEGTVTR